VSPEFPTTRTFVNVTVDGRATAQLHLQKPFTAQARSPEALAAAYLRSEGGRYGIAPGEVQQSAETPLGTVTDEGVRYRQVDAERIMATPVGYPRSGLC